VQIVIPMSGFGERFRRSGYTVPKPLIEVDGKPIIAHVLDLFPGETDVTLICNRDHLADPAFGMERLLHRLCPTARIVAIAPHRLGPVHAVLQATDHLDPSQPVIVNYCDFTQYWDWPDFKAFVRETACAGAIPAYRGFHPHSLGSTYYAYMQEHGGWVHGIQEKTPYTDSPMSEYASSGTYYFASAALMREAFEATVAQRLEVNGEYYVSLAYRPLLQRGHPVAVYELQHFMQWGTPGDLQEYQRWSAAFARMAAEAQPCTVGHDGMVLVPMAGLGSRFADAGYTLPKPLIPVSGRPMAVQAALDLPAAPRRRFVLRRDLPGLDAVIGALDEAMPGAEPVILDRVTDGQARSCLLGLTASDFDRSLPLTIGACDNGMLVDAAALDALLSDNDWDVIVWGVRGHPEAARKPQMFGWIDADRDGRIRAVSVKTPLATPQTDPIVVGAFTFRRASDFEAAANRMITRDARINGELYVDTCINDAIALGLRCRLFEIDHYLGWGTPDDLCTFEYWQSCFHKWPSHPYRLEHDPRVPPQARAALAERYQARRPPRPSTGAP
jgi:NDP-sugar pyrophosphorylase family protein